MRRLKAENKDAYDKMKRISELQSVIEEAFELDEEIERITQSHLAAKSERLVALKQKIERGIEAEGIKSLTTKKGKAVRTQAILKKLDNDGLYKKFGIKDTDVKLFTSEKLGKPSVRLYPN